MIPALLAVPMVQGLVGGVVSGVVNAFAPSTPPQTASTTFASSLDRATQAAPSSPAAARTGVLRADQWGQMSAADVQSWMSSLVGRHVDATDAAGHTLSGVVRSSQQAGQNPALSIGGHVVSLSSLKQISWSSSAV